MLKKKKTLIDYGARDPWEYRFRDERAQATLILAKIVFALGEVMIENNESLRQFYAELMEEDNNGIG